MSHTARYVSAVFALALALPLVSCAGHEPAPLGTEQNVRIGVKTADTFARADMAVTEVGELSAQEAAKQGLTISGYEDGVIFTVQVELNVTEGEYQPEGSYFLGETFWRGEGTGDIVAVTSSPFNPPELDGCHILDKELSEKLAAGDTVKFCQIMAAEAGTELESVTFGKRAGRRGGTFESWATV